MMGVGGHCWQGAGRDCDVAFGVCQWGMLFCGWQNSISHWQSGNFLKPKNFLAFWVPKEEKNPTLRRFSFLLGWSHGPILSLS